MTPPAFILASASPARRRLLQTVGIDPLVCPSGFDEDKIQVTEPAALVSTLAQCKAEAVCRHWHQRALPEPLATAQGQPALVMGCDSVLALDGEIHGKPADARDAIARWHQMRGNVGHLYTGHALIDLAQTKSLVRCCVTEVHFAKVGNREIEAYVASGEPLNCAGCFALEGRGGLFVEKLVGCHTNVIGLSLPLLRQMLHELDYCATDFWRN